MPNNTVSSDATTVYGAAMTTPALAEIADEGVTLKNFYAASSFTLPSHRLPPARAPGRAADTSTILPVPRRA